jgi:hypothetical protein
MRVNENKLIIGFHVFLCILSIQMVAPNLLQAAENNMTLTANPTSVVADGTPSIITATVFTGTASAPVAAPGVALVFKTTLGSFSGGSNTVNAISDVAGQWIVALSSTSAGTATVTCTSAGGINRVVLVTFTEPVPPEPVPTLTSFVLSVDPPSVPADNLTPSEVSAQLYDQLGKSLAVPGITVNFTTTPGGPAHFANAEQKIAVSTDANGLAIALIYSPVPGTAAVDATIGSLNTDAVFVNFTGVGYPAFISLSAAPNWIPSDGYSYTAITAVILDNSAKPVAAGSMVTFSTTSQAVFENGKATYSTITTDNKGTVTVYLRALNAGSSGTATVTCSAGSATQSLTITIVQLEYESEPNNDMSQADRICFNNVFLSQLYSPYEEDWYTFTITQPSRIGINFITTAIPKIAGDCKTSTTVGTYRVDIRDKDNNMLMSFQNVDCSLDNGIWETGVVPVGTYYVVVFCPRLPDNSHYLSSPYYLAVFNNYYFPCGNKDKLVNSASLSLESSAYHLYVPIIDATPLLWVDLLYDPNPATSLMFRVNNYGVLTNLNDFKSCNLSSLSLVDDNYVLHIPVLIINGVSYRVDLTYVSTTDGQIWFMLSGFWYN